MSSLNNFVILKKLGEGAFSEVYQGKRKSDNTIYAIKKVKMQKLTGKEKENALNEVRILASIQHPNIIGYKDCFFDDPSSCLCIVMEHADGGDLMQKIEMHKKRSTSFSEK
jgi:NIMA (never in mitosis gene a)-related kinase